MAIGITFNGSVTANGALEKYGGVLANGQHPHHGSSPWCAGTQLSVTYVGQAAGGLPPIMRELRQRRFQQRDGAGHWHNRT